jgi:hypothetical protein
MVVPAEIIELKDLKTVATGFERKQIGELISDIKAKANFYAWTEKSHPTDSYATIEELLILANGFSGAANLDPQMLNHPYDVIREYATKRQKQALNIIEAEVSK